MGLTWEASAVRAGTSQPTRSGGARCLAAVSESNNPRRSRTQARPRGRTPAAADSRPARSGRRGRTTAVDRDSPPRPLLPGTACPQQDFMAISWSCRRHGYSISNQPRCCRLDHVRACQAMAWTTWGGRPDVLPRLPVAVGQQVPPSGLRQEAVASEAFQHDFVDEPTPADPLHGLPDRGEVSAARSARSLPATARARPSRSPSY